MCRKKDSINNVNNSGNNHDNPRSSSNSFIFNVGLDVDALDNIHEVKGMLVDCGATTHIVTDESKFINFDENFNPASYFIELADGSRSNNLALKGGNACVPLLDSNGNLQNTTLENVLFVPTFKQDIFSVQAATDKSASVNFNSNHPELVSENGTKFNIKRSGRLYFLNSVIL